MSPFKLSSQAIRDVAEIITYLHREATSVKATQVEDQLFATFRKLAASPELGHLRPDITDSKIYFYTSKPYVIIFRRTGQRAQILRVTHGSRDLKRLV